MKSHFIRIAVMSCGPVAADTDAEVMWPDDDDTWTQQGVAHELGVSRYTVNKAIEKSGHIVGSNTLSIPSERRSGRRTASGGVSW